MRVQSMPAGSKVQISKTSGALRRSGTFDTSYNEVRELVAALPFTKRGDADRVAREIYKQVTR